jgi:signal transduction histidine kinase
MLARADAGERRLERVRLFMDDVMLDAADAARTIASRKNVSITVSDLEEAPVTGDAMLLRQLTLILLDNAIKYTEPNGAVFTGVLADGAMARLTIRDTGIGIPEDQLPHVFERFYRGDAARTRSGTGDTISEGAGLGLSIARWIVEEHGGVIDIESIVGRGTTVTVTLPLAEGAPRMVAT